MLCSSPLFSLRSDHHPWQPPHQPHFLPTFGGMLRRVYGCRALAQPLPCPSPVLWGGPTESWPCSLTLCSPTWDASRQHQHLWSPGCLPGPSPHGFSISSPSGVHFSSWSEPPPLTWTTSETTQVTVLFPSLNARSHVLCRASVTSCLSPPSEISSPQLSLGFYINSSSLQLQGLCMGCVASCFSL